MVLTGTGTGVGKTVVAAAVAAVALAKRRSVAVLKPAQTGLQPGEPGDVDEVTRLVGDDVTTWELARFPDPLAPATAARRAGIMPVTPKQVAAAAVELARGHDLVLVEGAGGLLVPMGLRPSGGPWTVADLAVSLDAQAVVVSRAGLGTLNHTALTLEALDRRGVSAGVVLGAWPPEPELVHWENLTELLPTMVGALPDGAGAMDPGVFQRSAPGWLTPPLYGVLDDWRTWAEEVS